MLGSQDEHKRPRLGEPALPSTESVTGVVRPRSLRTTLLSNWKDTKRTGEAKRRKYFLKNPLPNKCQSVRTIPPNGLGFYFYQVMNKPQYRGGGEPRCLRLPAWGRPLRAEGSSFSGSWCVLVAAG